MGHAARWLGPQDRGPPVGLGGHEVATGWPRHLWGTARVGRDQPDPRRGRRDRGAAGTRSTAVASGILDAELHGAAVGRDT